MGLDNVQVTTLCDPDMNILQQRAKEFEDTYGNRVKIEQDLRSVFDDPEIDAVGIIHVPALWRDLPIVFTHNFLLFVYG